MAYRLPAATTMQMTSDDFLAWDSGDGCRYELIDGQPVVMESASEGHQIVACNLYVAMRQHLHGAPCRAILSLEVRCDDGNCLVPDVMVYCDKDKRPRGMEACPLIVEVLSRSSARDDRTRKFARYRRLAALREYLVVDWEQRATEVHRLAIDGSWQVTRYAGGEVVYLASISPCRATSSSPTWKRPPDGRRSTQRCVPPRLLAIDISIPSDSPSVTIAVPPYEMNGSGTPTTGRMPVTMPMFTKT